MLICAYCGKEARGTKEHIISRSVLDLFPECFVTVDNVRNKIYESDPMVRDVCDECNNNRITYIDSYAKSIIEKYFLKKFEMDSVLSFEYDYVMIQKMLVKYAFNDSRSRKYDISFFDKNIVDWLLNESECNPRNNITIMAGLAVNTSPVPDFVFGNNKLRWGKNPLFLSNSIVTNLDYETGQISIREHLELESFKKLAFSYLFRFNSLQIIMMCWESTITAEELKSNTIVLGVQYPYEILNQNGKSLLKRCTSEITYHFDGLIDVSWGQDLTDNISYMRGTFSEKSQNYLKEVERTWKKEEEILAQEHPR